MLCPLFLRAEGAVFRTPGKSAAHAARFLPFFDTREKYVEALKIICQ